MLKLCKIRFQYLKKNRYLFRGYFYIPLTLIILFLPASIINGISERKKDYDYMASSVQYKKNYLNLDFKNKSKIKEFKKNSDKVTIFQTLINKYLTNENNLDNIPNITTLNSEYKSFNSIQKNFKTEKSDDIHIGFLISLVMSILSIYLIKRINEEKETKLVDLLESQGISKIKYILSWIVTFGFFTILPFILFLTFGGVYFVFRYHFFLINLVLYVLSFYSLIFFFLAIFSSPKKRALINNILNFATIIFGACLSAPKTNRVLKIIFCMFPNINIYYTVGILYIISDRRFVKRTNLKIRIKNISFIESLIFFSAQIVFYTLASIIIYFYKNSSFNFCLFLRSLCCRASRNNELNSPLIKGNEDNNLLNYEIHHQDFPIMEQQNNNENNCLKIVGITKKFGDLKAINNFNVELFPNEVFCLLGPKGAGKTTLINIISGLLKPDEGDILINGVSLITNKDFAYKNVGLCQEENKFFECLTVIEHLQFIYDIKGIQRNDNEIQDLILNLDLSDVQQKLCKDLSLGQKRKVCIALAFLSEGPIILLDEPTNGMEKEGKMKLWNFLKKYKKEKIILVTTHSVEEAENLGARIGIISDGQFICSGTIEYLKIMYPCSININLMINSKNFNKENKKVIFQKIKEYDPKAEIKMAPKGVFSIIIHQNNEHITEIFNYIEEIKEIYGIENYIVGSCSLEDAFLKINKKSNIKDIEYFTKSDESMNILVNRLKPAGFCPQLRSQLYKNLLAIRRNIIKLILEYLGSIIVGYIFLIAFSKLFRKKGDDYYLSIKNNKKVKIFSNFEIKSFLKKKVINNDSDIIIVGIMFGYYIFLSSLVFEKIKERRTKVKHLLYLSGCNMYSYWVAFFIIDFVKLLIFNVLLLIPIFIKTRIGLYLFLCFPLANLSSLVYIYLLSYFCYNEKYGMILMLVYLFLLTFLTLTLLRLFFLPLQDDIEQKKFIFSNNDFTPMTSLLMTLYRIIRSNAIDELDLDIDGYSKPKYYLIFGQIYQLIDFIVYFSLFLLNEKGYFAKCFMNCKSNDLNYVLSEEKDQEEFYTNNDLRNPILVQQNNNQNISNNNAMNNNQNTNLINSNIQNNINNQNDNNNINNFENQNNNAILIDIKDTSSSQSNISNNNNINNNMNDINQINNNALQNNREDIENNNTFVINEIQKLHSQMNLTTKIEGLYKTYFVCGKKNVRVLSNINLGLEPNEKFGLLGFNGSGKTTTFKVITNEILFEKGQITLFGNDTKTQFDQIRSMIGYCPQENPLFDYMKVREMINFYLKLTSSTETIESICSQFDLSKYIDTYCINLSKGNKRKLSLAIALMNKPSLLLLDEPTTGVDPESRRIIWKKLNELSNSGHQYNMILATHSIEEAEILCDRVSWLKKGNFACIGNPEQLKLQYSNGYKMRIKFANSVLNKNDASTLTNKMVEDYFAEINNLVKDFNTYSNYILGNPIIILLIKALIEVIKEIKPYTKDLKLLKIEKDISFKIQIDVLKEKQNILFSKIFNLKNKNAKISEISLNLESLGDILTSF